MAVALITVTDKHGSNNQQWERYIVKLAVGAGTYIPGGLPLLSVLLAALLPKTGGNPISVKLQSQTGSGYIYQYIQSTGNMMILQVPLTGSLTTAAPLSELLAGSTLSQVQNDVIEADITFDRNAYKP